MDKDTGLITLINICQYWGVNIDKQQIIHRYCLQDRIMTPIDIVKAAKDLNFKIRYIKKCKTKVNKLPMPCILCDKEGKFFILAKIVNEKVLILNAEENKPSLINTKELKEMWDGSILLFKHKKIEHREVKFGFKWFLPTILKYKRALIEVLIASLCFQILGLFTPIMMQVVIDKVLVHNSLTTLDVLTVGLGLILVFELVMGIAKNYVFANTTNKMDVILSSRLFNHLLRLPLRYFETRRVGDTVARVREQENIRRFLTGTPLTSILDVVFIVVYLMVMLFYSTKLTYIVVLSIPFFAILSAIATPLFRHRLDEKFNTGAEAQSYLVEAITGINTIKSLALEPTSQRKWESLQADYTNAGFKTAILSGNIGSIGQFIQKSFDLIILWYGAHLVIDKQISVGQLVAFRMLSSRVSSPILRLVQIWQDYQQTVISVRRIGDIFNTKPEMAANQSKTRLPNIEGNIGFKDVSFRYRLNTAEVIKNMSFNVSAGTVVGIVGRSGSGKSTLTKLIQRLYIPESGKILIDGVDISIVDPAWLRTQIGVVLQENFLFNMSIRDNIAINNPGAPIEQVIAASKIAGAHEFIIEFPEGYDTMIGEKGTGLSGGQKQRIAIARALLNNPKILILDEATSALDYESERIIQNNLKSICRGRTVLIIAHRLSTLKDADMIMSIDRGKLVEFGRPEELLKKNGLYSYLHSQQEGKR